MKHRTVQLMGTEALSISEAAALVKAAMSGRYALSREQYDAALNAIEKVGTALVAAGQNPSVVQALMTAE